MSIKGESTHMILYQDKNNQIRIIKLPEKNVYSRLPSATSIHKNNALRNIDSISNLTN